MVYLLHFDKKICHSQHYLGSVEGDTLTDVERRVTKYHMRGRGARFTQVAVEQGIKFIIARTWVGGKKRERQLKNQKQGPKLCPICREGYKK